MAKYKIVLMHGSRHGQDTHYFEAADDLLSHSPMTVIRAAMAGLEKETTEVSIGPLEWEVYSALKSDSRHIVSALGSLIFRGDQKEPFTALISADG